MKKKSALSNTPPASSTGNIQLNVSQPTSPSVVQQGYTKKKGCGCGKK